MQITFTDRKLPPKTVRFDSLSVGDAFEWVGKPGEILIKTYDITDDLTDNAFSLNHAVHSVFAADAMVTPRDIQIEVIRYV